MRFVIILNKVLCMYAKMSTLSVLMYVALVCLYTVLAATWQCDKEKLEWTGHPDLSNCVSQHVTNLTHAYQRFFNETVAIPVSIFIFRLDALALSVIATATWLAGWLGGCLAGCPSQPVLYQND